MPKLLQYLEFLYEVKKNSCVETRQSAYLRACPPFQILRLTWTTVYGLFIQFVAKHCVFRENRLCDSHALFKGVKEFPTVDLPLNILNGVRKIQ
jgi:hypothetical protein